MILPRPPRRRGPLALSLVAMVDVVMNLLFFFMMAARFPAWRTLPLDLGGNPVQPTGAALVLAPPVRLTLMPTGAIAWDGTPTPRAEIVNRLAAEPTRPARVEATAGVPLQDTLSLIEQLRTVSAAVTLDVPERIVAAATGVPATDAELPAPETLAIPAPDTTGAGAGEPSLADFLPGGSRLPGGDSGATPTLPVTGTGSTGTGANGSANGGPLPPPPPDPGATPARSGYVPDRAPAVTYDPSVADRPASSLPGYDDPYWTREKPAPGRAPTGAGATPPPDSGN